MGIVLVSCASTEESDTIASCEVSFDVRSITRASLTTSSNITAKPFAVYGDMIHQDLVANNTKRSVVFNGAQVRHNGTNWEYAVGETQYWFPDHEHSFVALHPGTSFDGLDALKYENSKLSFTYTLPENPDDATDILMATHRRQYTSREKEPSGTVSFRFAHMTSLVNLAITMNDETHTKKPDEYIEITNIKILGFKNKTTYSIAPASVTSGSQTDDRTDELVNDESSVADYVIDLSNNPLKIYYNKTAVKLFGDNGLIMLPQSSPGYISMEITYKDIYEGTILELSAKLSPDWKMGKSYLYSSTITVDKVGVKWDTSKMAEISNWTTTATTLEHIIE